MAKDIKWTSPEWCELVFEGKNKDFGAYKLRKTAPRRHITAYLIVVVCVIVALLLPAFIRFIRPVENTEKMVSVTALSDLKMDEPEVKEENKIEIEVPPPPPPALKSTIKFTAPVIKADEQVRDEDEIKTQQEVTETKAAISVADVKGNDEEHGKDIAELEEHKVIVQEEEKDEVFQVVEQPPAFPGGMEALHRWMHKELRYPITAQENGIEGRVYIQFVVGKDGAIRDVVVVRSVDPALDKEAVRMVEKMPRWIPGKQRGVPVSASFTLPVTFKLNQN